MSLPHPSPRNASRSTLNSSISSRRLSICRLSSPISRSVSAGRGNGRSNGPADSSFVRRFRVSICSCSAYRSRSRCDSRALA